MKHPRGNERRAGYLPTHEQAEREKRRQNHHWAMARIKGRELERARYQQPIPGQEDRAC